MNEADAIEKLGRLLENCPLNRDEIIQHIYLFLHRRTLAKLLFINSLYEKTVGVPGIIAEFGLHYGRNLALFESLRGVHEPYNHERRIVGFDTFEGFTETTQHDDKKDGELDDYLDVGTDYALYLSEIMRCQEAINPLADIHRHEIHIGDATDTLQKFLDDNPETLFSLAYMDMGIYQPTKNCLELLLPHMTKGAIIGFDQIHNRLFPGETVALKDVLDVRGLQLRRLPHSGAAAYVIL